MSTFSLSPKHNINYLAKIVQITNIRKHSNADRLQCTLIDGNNIIVDLSTKIGDIGVFFPVECAIHADFLKENSLFKIALHNKDGSKSGFFESTGRVKTLKLRGERSEGFFLPISSLDSFRNLSDPLPPINTTFDMVGNLKLLRKYNIIYPNPGGSNTPSRFSNSPNSLVGLIVPNQFRFHIDTPNLKANIQYIDPNHLITITKKLHGTSFISSKVLLKRKFSIIERIAKFFGANIQSSSYVNICSSRKIVKSNTSTDIYSLANQIIEPHLTDGMTVYGEIVGFMPNGKYIQKNYDYGCDVGKFDLYIYRITLTNPSGVVTDLSSAQVERWCVEHQLKPVPKLWEGLASQFYSLDASELAKLELLADQSEVETLEMIELSPERVWKNGFLEKLKQEYLEKLCTICKNKAWDEGIVLRIENSLHFDVFKLKSFNFLSHESLELDKGTLDIEAIQSDS